MTRGNMTEKCPTSNPPLFSGNPDAHPSPARPSGLRVIPSNWAAPLDLAAVFGKPPAPVEVDLGCGKGRFLLARARACPAISFLGIDRLRARVLKVERQALRLGLANVRLMFVEAGYAVTYLLPPGSVSTFYIFFPDPWPKRRHGRRRLFAAGFLNALQRTLVGRGRVHIATDYADYFESIREIFRRDPRFAEVEPFVPRAEERTEFELVFLNQRQPINRCSFELVRKSPWP